MKMFVRSGSRSSCAQCIFHGRNPRGQRYGRLKRFSTLLASVIVAGALCGVFLQPSAVGALPSKGTVIHATPCVGVTTCETVGNLGTGSLHSEGSLVESTSPPTITKLRFEGSRRDPEVVINGTGFGSVPSSKHANCGATGKNFPGRMLYLRDLTKDWHAGITGNCIGLRIDVYTNTMIKFRFGNYYNTAPYFYVLAPGDQFDFVVKDAAATGTVTYT